MKRSLILNNTLSLTTGGLAPLNAQTNSGKLSAEQIKEERAYGSGVSCTGDPLDEYTATMYPE